VTNTLYFNIDDEKVCSNLAFKFKEKTMDLFFGMLDEFLEARQDLVIRSKLSILRILIQISPIHLKRYASMLETSENNEDFLLQNSPCIIYYVFEKSGIKNSLENDSDLS
jgi:hypothetical protein